jgi:Superinfection immunity protein
MIRALFFGIAAFFLVGALALLYVVQNSNTQPSPHTANSPEVQRAFDQADIQHGITPTVRTTPLPSQAEIVLRDVLNVLGIVIAFIAGGIFYFLPSIVGKSRRNALAIFLLNLLLGWTLLGWVVALVWAAIPDQPSSSLMNTTSSPAAIP